ncbi:MAG: hypothetical protein M3Y21_06205 [Candidatus Eremiobacteraeota bacterium]|nr:hypothetical protein [Candidatus Eremiobacteraeota bacterium]
MAATLGARDLFHLVRKGIDVKAVHATTRKPFRFLLCGDPVHVAAFRGLLLSGHPDDAVPLDAAATLETISSRSANPLDIADARCVIFLGRPGDLAGADLALLVPLRLPIFAITVDEATIAGGPSSAPVAGTWAEYTVPALTREALRARVFPQLIECCKGVEIAVGRRLPALRESVCAKLTRDAANNSLKIALASAVIDHIPIAGIVLGAFASAGDMVAITGIQMLLLLHIEAVYGQDPDVQRMWQLLPVVGGGFGWRMLARELSGFIPVAGIGIKGAIGYAGTIVVGESVTFLHEHGHQMSRRQAAEIYERTKKDALRFARDTIDRFKKR